MTDSQTIINRLLLTEALANQLKKECYKTRKLIEASVSTPASDQQGLSKEQLAEVSAARRRRMLRQKNH